MVVVVRIVIVGQLNAMLVVVVIRRGIHVVVLSIRVGKTADIVVRMPSLMMIVTVVLTSQCAGRTVADQSRGGCIVVRTVVRVVSCRNKYYISLFCLNVKKIYQNKQQYLYQYSHRSERQRADHWTRRCCPASLPQKVHSLQSRRKQVIQAEQFVVGLSWTCFGCVLKWIWVKQR